MIYNKCQKELDQEFPKEEITPMSYPKQTKIYIHKTFSITMTVRDQNTPSVRHRRQRQVRLYH